MKIVPYEDDMYDQLVEFLKTNWAAEHSLYNRCLFDWQYCRGGDLANHGSGQLVLVDTEGIAGFLGGIPGAYDVRGKEAAGVGLTMWCVAERYRTSGLGVVLLREMERTHAVTFTLGANAKIVSTYELMGYSIQSRLHRYVAVLEPSGYRQLTGSDGSPTAPQIPVVNSECASCRCARGSLKTGDLVDGLHRLYESSVRPVFSFSRVRDHDFWRWRYLESAGFRYHILGDFERQGAAIVRIETIKAPDDPAADGLRILRLIELIPAKRSVWNEEKVDAFRELLYTALGFGQGLGCVAADYQCSSSRLAPVLGAAGLLPREFPQVFQPWRPNAQPINFLWRIPTAQAIDADESYFVKSDCDMDRPNLWPLPKEDLVEC